MREGRCRRKQTAGRRAVVSAPRPWVAEAVWCTTAAHLRDVLATRWPPPPEALVELIPQPGAADLRTRVAVRAVRAELSGDAALGWLEGLAERLRVAGSVPRLVEVG